MTSQFGNWFYWLVNLKSTVVFLGITYIQQSVANNLGFLIPFMSVLLMLIAIHMVYNNLIVSQRHDTTLGVFLNSLKMCCLHYRHLSGDVASWLDRAKENNGGCYSETHVENVKVLARLFPLYGLQILYRACITQIPSGYYIQTMNSNLHLNGFLLPIGAMNLISILPLLLLAPLMEFSIAQSRRGSSLESCLLQTLHHFKGLSVLVEGLSEVHRKGYPLTEQALSGKVLQVSSMACSQLAPQYILLGLAEPACISDTPITVGTQSLFLSNFCEFIVYYSCLIVYFTLVYYLFHLLWQCKHMFPMPINTFELHFYFLFFYFTFI
uniref:Uncharacterized protein n=1 Tax=Oncorhynchus kisutch TaxID=8019 RepID=A0A8C7GU54_ONCKI